MTHDSLLLPPASATAAPSLNTYVCTPFIPHVSSFGQEPKPINCPPLTFNDPVCLLPDQLQFPPFLTATPQVCTPCKHLHQASNTLRTCSQSSFSATSAYSPSAEGTLLLHLSGRVWLRSAAANCSTAYVFLLYWYDAHTRAVALPPAAWLPPTAWLLPAAAAAGPAAAAAGSATAAGCACAAAGCAAAAAALAPGAAPGGATQAAAAAGWAPQQVVQPAGAQQLVLRQRRRRLALGVQAAGAAEGWEV